MGKVNENEIRAAGPLKVYDSNHDGTISPEEFKGVPADIAAQALVKNMKGEGPEVANDLAGRYILNHPRHIAIANNKALQARLKSFGMASEIGDLLVILHLDKIRNADGSLNKEHLQSIADLTLPISATINKSAASTLRRWLEFDHSDDVTSALISALTTVAKGLSHTDLLEETASIGRVLIDSRKDLSAQQRRALVQAHDALIALNRT